MVLKNPARQNLMHVCLLPKSVTDLTNSPTDDRALEKKSVHVCFLPDVVKRVRNSVGAWKLRIYGRKNRAIRKQVVPTVLWTSSCCIVMPLGPTWKSDALASPRRGTLCAACFAFHAPVSGWPQLAPQRQFRSRVGERRGRSENAKKRWYTYTVNILLISYIMLCTKHTYIRVLPNHILFPKVSFHSASEIRLWPRGMRDLLSDILTHRSENPPTNGQTA